MPNENENTPVNDNQSSPNNFQSIDDFRSKNAPSGSMGQGTGTPYEVEPNTSTLGSNTTTEQPAVAEPAAAEPAVPSAAPVAAPVAIYSSSDQSTSNPVTGLTVAPKKSKKKFVIAGVTAGVLALLLGGGVAAYNLWYQNPDKVLGDALSNTITATTVATDSVITTKSTDSADPSSYDMNIKTVNDKNDARVDLSVTGDMQGKKFDVGGSFILKGNEKFYVKIDKLKELLEETGAKAFLGESASVNNFITKIDGNWIVINQKDIEEATGTKDDTTECIENALDKLRTDKSYSKELEELYKKNPLVKVKNKLGSKDGSLGYEIEFNRQNAINFANGMNSTKLYKDIKKCDDKIEDLDGEEMFKESNDESDDKAKVVVWVDRWSHEFTKLEVTGSSKDSSGTLTTTMKFDEPVKIEEPKDAITLEELKKDIEAIQQEMMQSYETSTPEEESMTSSSSFEI